MGIAAMGNRAALRQLQDAEGAPSTGSVATVVLEEGSAPIGGAAEPKKPGAEYLTAMAAWVPVEALALWTALATPFDIFTEEWKEFVTAGLAGLAAIVYSFTSVKSAQGRLGLEKARQKQIRTAVIGAVAFAVWWIGTPGAWATADAGLDPFLATVILVVAVAAIPAWARRWGIDPVTKAK